MRRKSLFFVIVLPLCLTSCTFINMLSSSSSTSQYIPSSSSYTPGEPVISTYENLVKNNVSAISCIPTSVEKPRILIIPVWFLDSNQYVAQSEKDTILSNINKAFFGTKEETGWYSVSEFYKQESFGKCELQGTVTSWYSPNITCSQAGQYSESTTANLVKDATNWYFLTTSDTRSSYDIDKDGYIDSVCLIYAAPNKNNSSQPKTYTESHPNFWAYTYWLQDTKQKNTYSPGVNAFLWASYDFMSFNTSHCNIDTHTYIHETGHLFGLDDYYDYNRPLLVESGYAGGFSMQDLNIGGHEPYSIYALGWGNPIEPKESTTITIKPFASDGDYIILRENDSTSAFDEYLLLEYYIPGATNELDSKYCYKTSYPQGSDIPGIRLWHVDARLIQRVGGNYSESNITNTIIKGKSYRHLCTNNTYDPNNPKNCSPLASINNYGNYRLLNLIRKGDSTGKRTQSSFTKNDLFVKDDVFHISLYKNQFVEQDKLNNLLPISWTFKIDDISSTSATITFNKTTLN